ncbi:MAG: hypothetical protein ISS47_03140 [Candidatus Omnitrophica bacterium]|nr:hypothetical protein [Candidatus Omnitrophota bacterium]
MEKKQYDLCLEVLGRLDKAGILDNFILIGSWCVYFYKKYFDNEPYIDLATIRTRDIDLLIDNPVKIKGEADIPELLKDLGFVAIFKGSKGYIKLDHPDLILELLVPERGRGINKPYPLPKLGMNAVTLRFLNFLTMNLIKVNVEDFTLKLPHPANFALHKLIIFQRRAREEKAVKDRNIAIHVIRALMAKGDQKILKKTFLNIPTKWQKKVLNGLDELDEKGIIETLK